jgi:uncharacterized protein with FMN-binding domain
MLKNTGMEMTNRIKTLLLSAALAPLVFATAAAAAGVVLPPGFHLQDGDFVSDPQTFEWGTLQLKLTIHDGAITAADALQMPAHRRRSVELSEMAKPILLKEAIQSQKSAVNIVSSATLTSVAFQNAMTSALTKAARH